MNRAFDLFDKDICVQIASKAVNQGDYRLDPGHFLEDINTTLRKKLEFTKLYELCNDIIEPKLFTRIYCDKKYGLPYISSSEMTEIEPPINNRFISRQLTNDISQYIIKRGQILVSAAGTVGNIIVAPDYLNGVAGTSDILRIEPAENNLGFIYTYLTSSFGSNELTNLAYGAIIKRVRGFQLENLKTPIIDGETKEELNNLVHKSLATRENAHRLLTQARQLVLEYNHLPPLEDAEPDTLDPDKETDLRLVSTSEFTDDYRLDAHFYSHRFKKVMESIHKNAQNYLNLNKLVKNIFIGYRFARNYVDVENGIPLIGTRNTLQIRPTNLKYLSRTETEKIDELILQKELILVARSGSLGGTFGRVGFVWKNFEKYCGSEHIIRVNPDKSLIDPAYLYAYLSCDYGYASIIQLRHGALIDEIDQESLGNILIPVPKNNQQKEIGDLVRKAYDLRADAIRLEDEAQEILTQALTGEIE